MSFYETEFQYDLDNGDTVLVIGEGECYHDGECVDGPPPEDVTFDVWGGGPDFRENLHPDNLDPIDLEKIAIEVAERITNQGVEDPFRGTDPDALYDAWKEGN